MQSIAMVTLIALLTPGAQIGVDFSGTWILESASSQPDAPQRLVVDQPITTTNVRGEPMPPAFVRISIRRLTKDGASTSETRHINVVGGSIEGGVGPGTWTRRTHIETLWEGNRLVFDDGSYTGDSPRTGEWSERREVWSLTADGATLVVEVSTESSASPPLTETRTYKRSVL